jgi:hypothetical protein
MQRFRLTTLLGSICACLLASALVAEAQTPSPADSHVGRTATPAVAALLDQIRQNDRGQLAISREDAGSSGCWWPPRRASVSSKSRGLGYSAIWMGWRCADGQP